MNDLKHIIKLLEDQGKKIDKIEKFLESQQNNILLKSDAQIDNSEDGNATRYAGLTKAIFDLIGDSFFNKPKDLMEIQEQLKSNAVFYPRTNYPKPLLLLIRNKHLRRIKENNKWKYVKY